MKMWSSRGRLHSMKIDIKSTWSTLKQERKQGSTLMQAGRVKVDFVPYLPIQNQLFILTIRAGLEGGRKWGRARATPIETKTILWPGIYDTSWFWRLLEAFGRPRGEVVGRTERYKPCSVVRFQKWYNFDRILEDFWLPKWKKIGGKTAKKRVIWR